MFKKILLSLLLLTAVLNATAPTQESVAKLYVATFDRAPDAVGLAYWLDDSGLSLEQIAMSFFDQKETQEKYPSGTATGLFVETVYANLFNRTPDDTGLEYWIAELDSGRISRSVFILAVINGALGDDAVILNNKMEVGLYFAQKGLNDAQLAKDVMKNINADPESVERAIEMIDGYLDPTIYTMHEDITTTMFWTGEEGSSENGYIPNLASAWDNMWMLNYGGVDTPNDRNGYYPSSFTPTENPFYFALPYNDFDENGNKKTNISSYIPWASSGDNSSQSICKNRWIKITKGEKIAYAQWEDVGPFGEDDQEYVFGNSSPKNQINNSAGLDVSPAVRDYLNLNDIDTVNWKFVNYTDVPDGPWRDIITDSNINWVDWYKPETDTSWQWQLTGVVNTSYDVEVYDIDLFDSSVTLIRSLQQSTKKVICYFSAGSYEEWRDDAGDFPNAVLGDDMDGWAGEKWLDISNVNLYPIMKARLDLAKQKGCDGVEPDNMDGYTNNTGFNLSAEDQLVYNKFIANEARKRGLSVGLKNDVNQIAQLEPFFDFSVNEQCHFYNECSNMQPFIDASKPVWNAEYAQEYIDNSNGERDNVCADAIRLQFKTLVLPLGLDDDFRYSCF